MTSAILKGGVGAVAIVGGETVARWVLTGLAVWVGVGDGVIVGVAVGVALGVGVIVGSGVTVIVAVWVGVVGLAVGVSGCVVGGRVATTVPAFCAGGAAD
jgi:hypothetical protein